MDKITKFINIITILNLLCVGGLMAMTVAFHALKFLAEFAGSSSEDSRLSGFEATGYVCNQLRKSQPTHPFN